MTKNWWQKLIDWFSDEALEMEENDKLRNLNNRRPGRIEENARNVHPRVVHHYPQDDKFGSSLNIEPRPKGNDQPDTQPYIPKEARTALHDKKEMFTGVNFKAEDIPSPVFGFHKRRNLEQHNIYFKQENVLEQEIETFGEEVSAETEPELHTEDKTVINIPVDDYYGLSQKPQEPQEPQEEDIKQTDDERVFDQSQQSSEKQSVEGEQDKRGQDASSNDKAGHASQQKKKTNTVVQEKPKRTERQPSGVPYNVMMFKQDKVKMQKSNVRSRSKGDYKFPGLSLLAVPPRDPGDDESWLRNQQNRLEETLHHFNVKANVVGVTKGPAVTRFEIQPAPGVKVNKITKLNDDLKLSLAAKDIRIEAPIPGKNLIGIEIPNRVSKPVFIREIIRERVFQNHSSSLTAALGLDISGSPVVTDLQDMPHGLIAGATGSGKSVCINSLLVSLLFKASPEEVKLLLIDPKMVELAPFQDVPHLAAPVITDPKEASLALKWAVEEMERRYEAFAESGVRDIAKYNKKQAASGEKRPMPYIVIVIDELADLMMISPQDVEEAICRIAQKARACGIHLILATQRPSVDVITGLIKANVPTRIAFSVSSQADSRTILDTGGAEKLLGKGDMLFIENGSSKSVRVQGNFVSDEEIDTVVDFVKRQSKPEFLFHKEELLKKRDNSDSHDELFEEVCYYVLEQGSASSSALQRRFRIGYNRAARLVEMMEAKGIVSEAKGSKPRHVLMSAEEFQKNVLEL